MRISDAAWRSSAVLPLLRAVALRRRLPSTHSPAAPTRFRRCRGRIRVERGGIVATGRSAPEAAWLAIQQGFSRFACRRGPRHAPIRQGFLGWLRLSRRPTRPRCRCTLSQTGRNLAAVGKCTWFRLASRVARVVHWKVLNWAESAVHATRYAGFLAHEQAGRLAHRTGGNHNTTLQRATFKDSWDTRKTV